MGQFEKRIVALGIAATSICSSSIGTYTNVMAQDIATNEHVEEAEAVSEVPEEIATEEVIPEEIVNEETRVEKITSNNETADSNPQTFSVEDDLADIKNTNMQILEGLESMIFYPSTDISNRIIALKSKINNMTDISEVEAIQQEISDISDVAEVTIYSCNITYDESYPYKYVNDEDLQNINWFGYQENFTIDLINILGDSVPSVIFVDHVEYSEEINKLVFTITPTGRQFTNANSFTTTVAIPVQQVENVEDNTELTMAQDEAIRFIKSEIDSLTQECSADLKAKVIELQNGYIARIKNSATIDDITVVLNEAINYLPGFVQNGGIGTEELREYIENAVIELCKDAGTKRQSLTDNGKNLFTDMIVKAEGEIRASTSKEKIDNILKEAEDFYTNLKAEEDRIKKELQDAKNAFIAELNAIDVTKYDEGDRETLIANIQNARTTIILAPAIESLNSAKDVFYDYFSKLQTTEDKVNAKLVEAKTNAIKELDTMDYSFLNSANKTKVAEKIELIKISIQSASSIPEVHTFVEQVKIYIQTLKWEEEAAGELEGKRTQALAELNGLDLSLYDRVDQTYIKESLKTPAISKISEATTVSEITQALTEFYESVEVVKTIAQKVIAEKQTVITYINNIAINDLLEVNQVKAANYFSQIKVEINSATTVMQVKQLKGQIITFMKNLREEDAEQRVEAEALIQAKQNAKAELDAIVTDDLSTENKTKIASKITQAKTDILNAGTVVEINTIVQTLNDFVTAIRGGEQIEREFQQLKTSYTTTVNNVNEADYDEIDKVGITTLKSTALTVFGQAATKEQLTIAMNTFQTRLAGYKTTADKEAEKLVAKIEAAVNEIKAIDLTVYNDTDKKNLETQRTEIIRQMNGAVSEAEVDLLVQDYKDNLRNFETSAEKEAKKIAKAKANAKKEISEYNISMMAESFKMEAKTVKDNAVIVIENAPTVDAVLKAFNQTMAKLDQIKADDMAAKMLVEAKASASAQIGSIQITDYDDEDQEAVKSLLNTSLAKIEEADTIDKVAIALAEFEGKLNDIYTTAKKAEINKRVVDTEAKLDAAYKNATASMDIGKIDMSTIKEEAKGDLKAYFAVANYRVEQILEKVKEEIQKLIDEQGQAISLMLVEGGYRLMLGTRSIDSILGIDISGLTDENKAKAMEIFNKAIAEINQILADTHEYVQSVTKVPDNSASKENQPSNNGSQPEERVLEHKEGNTTEKGDSSTNVSDSKSPQTGDEANPILPMTGIFGALAYIGYFLKKKK